MRRSEITPELIELSKKAKALGFPQEVEEGDWIYCPPGNYEWEIRLVAGDGAVSIYRDILKNLPERGFFPILSFSRCLEWFSGKIENVELWQQISQDRWYFGWTGEPWMSGKTHHEAIAKAVVKMLEEK